MALDEQATIAALDAARKTFRTSVNSHGGRVIDTAGDSVLAIFRTASGAVDAAIEIQTALRAQLEAKPPDRRLLFRIGVHLGDVTERPDGSVYGEGVNIAARLEGIAIPGGIAVSEAVFSSVRNRVSASFEDLGAQQMKNIDNPVHVFRIRLPGPLGLSDESHGGPLSDSKLAPHASGNGIQDPNKWMRVTGLRSVSHWAMTLLLAVVLLIGLSYAWLTKPLSDTSNSKEKSIAVLPFVDMSEKHDQEYFSDGLSEELIDRLARAGDLKVIARTSSFQFKGKNEDTRVIAQQLGVTHLLEGSVRKHGDQLRITAQLIGATDGTHLWSQTYERSYLDIFKIQDEIARTVSQALRVAMNTRLAKDDARPSDVRAHTLLLEGHYFKRRNNKFDLEKAIRLYQEAIQIEPSYAMAWVGLAEAHSLLGENFGSLNDVARAREAVEHALRLDPQLAEAHAARGSLLKGFDWDWQGAVAEYRRANELSSNPHRYDSSLAGIGLLFGRIDESISAKSRVVERDPVSAGAVFDLGNDLYMARRYDQAAAAFRKVTELDPAYATVRACLSATLVLLGRQQEALGVVEQEQDEAWKASALPVVYWALGKRQESDAAMAILESKYSSTAAFQIAQAHAYRGDIEVALNWLERAYRERDSGLQWSKVDPLLRNLLGNPRFQAFLVKMKLDGDGSFLR